MKYTKEVLEDAVKHSKSVMDVLRYLQVKYSGGSYCHINNAIKKFEIDTSNFAPTRNRGGSNKSKHWSEILINNVDKNGRCATSLTLHKALISYGAKYICNRCENNGKWLDNDLTLHVHHLNEIVEDNRPENLIFLCPNCHEQHHLLARKSKPKIKKKRSHTSAAPKQDISKELLESLLLEIGTTEIAKKYNVVPTTVRRWLKHYNIKHVRKDYTRNTMFVIDKDILEKLVWEKPLTGIASDYNKSVQTIYRVCKQLKIDRPKSGYWSQFQKKDTIQT